MICATLTLCAELDYGLREIGQRWAYFGQKCFYACYAVGRKVFFYPTVAIFFSLIKKLRYQPFKIFENRDFFSRKLFFNPLAISFSPTFK
jgi:hypothetical protein